MTNTAETCQMSDVFFKPHKTCHLDAVVPIDKGGNGGSES